MKTIAPSACVVLAPVILALLAACAAGDSAPGVTIEPVASPTLDPQRPTPVPATWIEGLQRSGGGDAVIVSCLDANADFVLDASDGADFANLAVPLAREITCVNWQQHREYYAGPPSEAESFDCRAPGTPLLVVAVGGGGTELQRPLLGESLGLLDITNRIQARAGEAGISSAPILSTGAIDAADLPQTRMGEFLREQIALRMDAAPCLRAVMMGHSHGAVTVTSIAAALDERYGGRLFAVILDRSNALYDRPTEIFPARAPVLNVFQLNEGWHGVPLDLPNVTNVDESAETASENPSGGGGPLVPVTHLTLDDSAGVQQRIVDRVMAWLRDADSP